MSITLCYHDHMNHALIGEIAGALALLQIIPYVVSILRGHTKPERMSYFLWLIVDTMGVASYVAVGAHTTVWVQFAFVFTGGLVFLMSIKYGIGGFSHFDLFCFAVAIAGGVLAAQTPTSFITAGAGLALGLKGFIAAILGGFDKLGLTLVGGMLVAFVEVAFARFVDAAQASTVMFALLIVLLIVRPQGLTRKVAADRV